MGKLFDTGAQFPPANAIERLAKYERGRRIFEGKPYEVYERATELLKETPHAPQLQKLYIAVNIIDVLITKAADLMFGEPPSYESGLPDDSPQQQRLNSIVEENDLNQIGHEIVIGAGIRGDAWIKVFYDRRGDFSEVPTDDNGTPLVDLPAPEPIIEAVDPSYVFPELSRGSRKRFKAVNIAWVEWVETRNDEIPYLNVERHVPGFIMYERYRLQPKDVDNTYGAPIQTFTIGEQVETDRDSDIVETGLTWIPVFHVPYKTTDDDWQGISGIEKLESVLAAINDRLVQIDYILWKHSDPTAYGPDLGDINVRISGRYIPVGKDDQTPGYMTWDSQLDGAFKELDYLIGLVFQMSETPQWLFGTTLTPDSGGTGTSHTDGVAIKARFMPILSKIKRIRVHVDRAFRDALWTAMELENFANEGVEGFTKYEPVYPTIAWKDGIPRDEKELAEIMQIRTGGKPTIDVQSAIKRMDEVDDDKAREIMTRIEEDEKTANGFVDSSIFNGGVGSDS
ncbi:phage portal protein [Brevibacillus sp. SYP-B805]|uniref:phage portal protein n=1 Tax=Brevibacillus sp. SYP-B805 TaxID=1578199 RepID=UPI001F49C6B5|nr:phage portal protein [Brevibacillus sp. SYP-B805]